MSNELSDLVFNTLTSYTNLQLNSRTKELQTPKLITREI